MGITVFKTTQKIELKQLKRKLNMKPIIDNKNKVQGKIIKLHTTFDNISHTDNFVRGFVTQDYLDEWEDRSGNKHVSIKTKTTMFTFYNKNLGLLIHAPYNTASKIAVLFSKIIYPNIKDPILTRSISPDKLSKFLSNNNCAVLGCSWIDLNLPNLDKTHITGVSINESSDFKRYDNHGIRNNVFFKLPPKNITLSLSRNATVSIRTKLNHDEQEEFIIRNIIKLCA